MYESDEETMQLRDDWKGAVVLYVISHHTGYSSQLHGHFAHLRYRLRPSRETAVLLEGVRPDEVIFPELDAVSRTPLHRLAGYLADVK